MNVLLLSMPDSFEHMAPVAVRVPNGALTSIAGNVDPGRAPLRDWRRPVGRRGRRGDAAGAVAGFPLVSRPRGRDTSAVTRRSLPPGPSLGRTMTAFAPAARHAPHGTRGRDEVRR